MKMYVIFTLLVAIVISENEGAVQSRWDNNDAHRYQNPRGATLAARSSSTNPEKSKDKCLKESSYSFGTHSIRCAPGSTCYLHHMSDGSIYVYLSSNSVNSGLNGGAYPPKPPSASNPPPPPTLSIPPPPAPPGPGDIIYVDDKTLKAAKGRRKGRRLNINGGGGNTNKGLVSTGWGRRYLGSYGGRSAENIYGQNILGDFIDRSDNLYGTSGGAPSGFINGHDYDSTDGGNDERDVRGWGGEYDGSYGGDKAADNIYGQNVLSDFTDGSDNLYGVDGGVPSGFVNGYGYDNVGGGNKRRGVLGEYGGGRGAENIYGTNIIGDFNDGSDNLYSVGGGVLNGFTNGYGYDNLGGGNKRRRVRGWRGVYGGGRDSDNIYGTNILGDYNDGSDNLYSVGGGASNGFTNGYGYDNLGGGNKRRRVRGWRGVYGGGRDSDNFYGTNILGEFSDGSDKLYGVGGGASAGFPNGYGYDNLGNGNKRRRIRGWRRAYGGVRGADNIYGKNILSDFTDGSDSLYGAGGGVQSGFTNGYEYDTLGSGNIGGGVPIWKNEFGASYDEVGGSWNGGYGGSNGAGGEGGYWSEGYQG